jgi:DNA-binding NarL/FixJ family response regulator
MPKIMENNGSHITAREQQIINKILDGLPNKKIADELFISERTVKFHCSNIYRKLNTSGRATLIVQVHRKLDLSTG